MIIPITAPLTVSGLQVAEVDARIEVEPTSNDPNDGFDVTAVEVKCLDGKWRSAVFDLADQIMNAAPSTEEIDEALREDGAWPTRDELRRQIWIVRDDRGWHLRLASQKNCRLICRVNGDEVAR